MDLKIILLLEKLKETRLFYEYNKNVRYKDKPLSVWSNEEKANHLIECSLGIEKQVFQYCSLKPEDINDKAIQEYIEKLKEYDI